MPVIRATFALAETGAAIFYLLPMCEFFSTLELQQFCGKHEVCCGLLQQTLGLCKHHDAFDKISS
jgi:hypothetical protein